jgi:hypothetical protein
MNNLILKINKIYNYIFGEKFYKKINYDFDNNLTRSLIVNNIIDRKKYETYLEIGCDKNILFNSVKIKKKIGIDPVSGGNLRMTSDSFFKNNQNKFDLIFIDGLHQYEQVKRDVYNSLKFLNDHGVILLHDCMPSSFMRQAPKRSSNIWNGDVWRNIVELRTLDQIDTYTIYADHGIGLILKRKNRNKLLLNIKSFKKLKFKDYYKNYKLFLNIVHFEDLDQLF